MKALDLIIRNGQVVNPDRVVTSDVGIRNGRIDKISVNLRVKAAEEIDARSMYVMPGGIDPHVHFHLLDYGTITEDWDTATAAAACGGVTTVIDFAFQQKGRSLKESIEERIEDARDKVCIDYSLHAGISDWNQATREEMRYYTTNGIPSFKMLTVPLDAEWMADDAAVFSVLEETRESGGVLLLHAESASVLDLLIKRYHTAAMMKKHGAYCHVLSHPPYTEYEAIQRANIWARATDGRLCIAHVSTAEGADSISCARKDGVGIRAETCPHYLLLTDDVFKRENGHYYATTPQIRKHKDSVRLLEAIQSGTIQILSTDSCTYTTEQKNIWGGDFTKIPYGLPGVETFIPTMFTFLVHKHNLSLERFVSLVSTNAARLYGLYPQKGAILEGSDADILVLDPAREVTIDYKKLATNCDWSPYQGMKLTGYPYVTISRGKIVAREGRFTGEYGWGRFLKGKPGGKI